MKIRGVRFSGIACGIKKNGKNDLALAVFDTPAVACGVFTKNRVAAPSVALTRKNLAAGRAGALLVVSGNASVCVTGADDDARKLTGELARKLGLDVRSIAHATTGVIGVRMPVGKAIAGLDAVIAGLGADHQPFSEGIRTTDAFEKIASATCVIGGKKVNILGIGKGAGMIAPDMATMLMFLFTDAAIGAGALKKAFVPAVDASFNSISVDGDTSTNDMVLAFATGTAGNAPIQAGGQEWRLFASKLEAVCLSLAKQVVKDGEGATKLVSITVKGAKSQKAAKTIARTVAGSQLVKTAFFGEDPNWGRIMAAVGRSGVAVNTTAVDIDIQGMPVVRKGFEEKDFSESRLAAALKKPEISVVINLNAGSASTTFYTSDLTFEYVKINSAYRT